MLGSLACRICQFHNMGFTHPIFSNQYIQATAKRDLNILKYCKIFCFYLCQRHFKHLFYQSILLSDYYCTIPSQFHQSKNSHNRKKDSSPASENESPDFLSIELHPSPGTPDMGVHPSFPFRVRCQKLRTPSIPGRSVACYPAATSDGNRSPAFPTYDRPFQCFAAASLLRSPADNRNPYSSHASPAAGRRLFFRSNLRSPSDSDSCSTSAIPVSKNSSLFSPVSNRSDNTVCEPVRICVFLPGGLFSKFCGHKRMSFPLPLPPASSKDAPAAVSSAGA